MAHDIEVAERTELPELGGQNKSMVAGDTGELKEKLKDAIAQYTPAKKRMRVKHSIGPSLTSMWRLLTST